MTPLERPGAPKMEATITPGAAQDVEKWSKNFSGGSPAGTNDFFSPPGGLQERSGADFYSVLAATWGPGGPRRPPGPHFLHFGIHFGLQERIWAADPILGPF